MKLDARINVNFGGMLDGIRLPAMYRFRQKLKRGNIKDVEAEIRGSMRKMFQTEGQGMAPPVLGPRIAVAVGSRGISRNPEIVRTVLNFFREMGLKPFIVPAMGSHGGGTAEGQTEVLAHLGITAESMGVPIENTMETKQIGVLSNGLPVYFSKAALEADGIFVINKIKPHADFKAEHESGLIKMLAIGLGKHRGCASLHSLGFENFSWALPEAASEILKRAPILGGLAVVEDGCDQPMILEAVPTGEMFSRDRELLKEAKAAMARLKFREIDVLVIDEIGKNISGEGMDPNVTGRPGSLLTEGFDAVKIRQIVVRGITEASGGNGAGIGMADLTTLRCVESLDLGTMYTNSITAGILGPSRLPVILNSDREAMLTAVRLTAPEEPGRCRLVHIKNTLELEEFYISEALLEEGRMLGQVGPEKKDYQFDGSGYLGERV